MDVEDYVELKPGKPVRVVFDAYAWVNKIIRDVDLDIERSVESLKFHVIRVDDKEIDTIYSAIASGIKNELRPYLEGDKYKDYEFTLLKGMEAGVGPKMIEAKKIAR